MFKLLLVVLLLVPATSAAQSRLLSIEPDSGPTAGGTLVLIRGSNLGSCGPVGTCFPADVFFGGVEGRIITITNDSITAVTPAHGAGAVEVRYNFGGSLPNGFTYVDASAAAPIPTLSQWGTMILALGLAIVALARLKI